VVTCEMRHNLRELQRKLHESFVLTILVPGTVVSTSSPVLAALLAVPLGIDTPLQATCTVTLMTSGLSSSGATRTPPHSPDPETGSTSNSAL
jgi:hypothetical protein